MGKWGGGGPHKWGPSSHNGHCFAAFVPSSASVDFERILDNPPRRNESDEEWNKWGNDEVGRWSRGGQSRLEALEPTGGDTTASSTPHRKWRPPSAVPLSPPAFSWTRSAAPLPTAVAALSPQPVVAPPTSSSSPAVGEDSPPPFPLPYFG